MDKLEKALEKARAQREFSVSVNRPAVPQRNVSGGVAYTPEHSSNPLPSAQADVVEEMLERHRILAHHSRSPEADVFRILRTQILQIMDKGGYRTLAITSPQYGDGKTVVCLNLALSIALDLKQTVLLVDMDIRKPKVHEFVGLGNDVGLTDYLTRNVPIPDCLARLPFDRLCILPGGTPCDNSSEIIGSPRMASLAHELKTRYPDRIVIYDMPPVLAQDDAIAFLPKVDATLLVVRDGITTADELRSCMEKLSGANIIGTVLNDARQNYV